MQPGDWFMREVDGVEFYYRCTSVLAADAEFKVWYAPCWDRWMIAASMPLPLPVDMVPVSRPDGAVA